MEENIFCDKTKNDFIPNTAKQLSNMTLDVSRYTDASVTKEWHRFTTLLPYAEEEMPLQWRLQQHATHTSKVLKWPA